MAEPIRLIVGLGNPGAQYELTRHNAGFWLADHLADNLNASFRTENNFFGDLAKARVEGENVFILKPNTFMNLSGKAVQAVSHFYKIPLESILVLHDELDLLPGELKLKKAGGHAGHNGLRDIHKMLGSPNYWRLRIGIGHPKSLNLQQSVVGFVLQSPRQSELEQIEEAIEHGQKIMPALLAGDMDKASRQLASAQKKAKKEKLEKTQQKAD